MEDRVVTDIPDLSHILSESIILRNDLFPRCSHLLFDRGLRSDNFRPTVKLVGGSCFKCLDLSEFDASFVDLAICATISTF